MKTNTTIVTQAHTQVPTLVRRNQIIQTFPPGFGSDHVQHVNVEPAISAFESTVNLSPEIGLNLPATDTMQAAGRVRLTRGGIYTSYSSFCDIRPGYQHCSVTSSSTATRSSLPGHIWHGCRHLFTASGSAASCSFLPGHIWHSFQHLFTASSSATSYFSSSRSIQHSYRHCPAPSSSAASYSSSSQNMRHNCQHCLASSSGAAFYFSSSQNIRHSCLHRPAPSSSAASFYFACSFFIFYFLLGVSWLGAQLPSFLIP
ncbi:unnamed protein product [Prunus brigantina]